VATESRKTGGFHFLIFQKALHAGDRLDFLAASALPPEQPDVTLMSMNILRAAMPATPDRCRSSDRRLVRYYLRLSFNVAQVADFAGKTFRSRREVKQFSSVKASLRKKEGTMRASRSRLHGIARRAPRLTILSITWVA
jgi:hypothetical protein